MSAASQLSCAAHPYMRVRSGAGTAPQQCTAPPLNGTTGSSVPEKAVIAIGCEVPHPCTKMITATAPKAANRSKSRHASTDVMPPPSDIPVENTRFASTQKVASM